MTKLAIFYEDSRMVGSTRYPLHELVCACLADALGQPYEAIKALGRAIPKNGDSKLLEACQIEVPNMREPVIGKNHLQRDKLLESAVWASREQRDCIRARIPSFAHFIDTLAPKVASLLAS